MAQRRISTKEAEIIDLSKEIEAEGFPPREAAAMALSALPLGWTDPSFVDWLDGQGS